MEEQDKRKRGEWIEMSEKDLEDLSSRRRHGSLLTEASAMRLRLYRHLEAMTMAISRSTQECVPAGVFAANDKGYTDLRGGRVGC